MECIECEKEIKEGYCLDCVTSSNEGHRMLTKKKVLDLVKNLKLDEKMYGLNRQISMKWIGLKQKPTEQEISFLNRKIGEWIKDFRLFEEKIKEMK